MTAIFSEVDILYFLKNKLNYSDADARKAIAEIAAGNERLEKNITEKVDDRFKDLKDIFMTKDDKFALIQQMADDKVTVIQKISEYKTSTIGWMFGFWIGQVGVIAGFLMYFLKK